MLFLCVLAREFGDCRWLHRYLGDLRLEAGFFQRLADARQPLVAPPRGDQPPYPRSGFLFELAKYPNVYFKMSTNNVRFSREGGATPETFFPLLIKNIPSNRIAWGSNCPASAGTLKEMVTEAKAALSCLSQADQDNIFAKTAQKLYPALKD